MRQLVCVPLFVLTAFLAASAFAADKTDVVYLSNGSIIRGSIVEIVPNESVKIQTADGSVFVFKMSEVIRIAAEEEFPAHHLTESSSKRLMQSFPRNALIFTWFATAFGYVASGDRLMGTTVIPVIGPWLTISRIEEEGGKYPPGGKSLLTISGVLQSGFCVWWMAAVLTQDNGQEYGVRLRPSVQGDKLTVSYIF